MGGGGEEEEPSSTSFILGAWNEEDEGRGSEKISQKKVVGVEVADCRLAHC